MVLQLIESVSLLLALCFVHGLLLRRLQHRPRLRTAAAGLLFGAVAILGMFIPVLLMPGVIVDARSVILSMAALFGGWRVSLIAGLMAGIYRFWLGGDGAIVGILVIISAIGLGLLYRFLYQQQKLHLAVPELLAFGLGLHLWCLFLFSHLPPEVASKMLSNIAPAFLLVFTPATLVLGLILQDQQQFLATENALLLEKDRLETILNALPDFLFVVDEEGCLVEILSPDAERLYMPADKALNKTLAEIFPVEISTLFMNLTHKTLQSQKMQRLTYSLPTPAGICHFEAVTQPLKTPVQGKRAIVWLARDITEAHQRNQQLQTLMQTTAQQHRRLRDFTYIVSHHLRAQVANLRGVLENLDPETPEERQEAWGLIGKLVQKLDLLLHDLNDIMAQQDPHRQSWQRFSVQTALQNILHTEAASLAEASVSVSIPAELELSAIPAYFEQIVREILHNAVRYVHPERPLQLKLQARQSGNQLVLSIQDNGLGMDLTRHGHKLFGLYQVFHSHPEARGLGLFMVKSQIESLGGQIRAESQPGKGSTFKLFFPLTQTASPLKTD